MPSTGPPRRGEVAHRRHDRREPCDRAGAQVVAVREPARQNDDVGALQARLLVPDELGVLPEHVLGGVVRVVIAVRTGKDDDANFIISRSASALSLSSGRRFALAASAVSDTWSALRLYWLATRSRPDSSRSRGWRAACRRLPPRSCAPDRLTRRQRRARRTCPAARRRRPA